MKNPANTEPGLVRPRTVAAEVPDPGTPSAGAAARRNGWVLWAGVVLAFSLLVLAYVFVFRAAHQAQIKDVPLATKGGRP